MSGSNCTSCCEECAKKATLAGPTLTKQPHGWVVAVGALLALFYYSQRK